MEVVNSPARWGTPVRMPNNFHSLASFLSYFAVIYICCTDVTFCSVQYFYGVRVASLTLNPQPERPGDYSLSEPYSSIFPIWVTLTGVKDSHRHSSTGHRDTQATQSQQGGDPDEMVKELDFKCPLTTQKFEFDPQNEDFMSKIYFHFTWNQQPSHFETSFVMLLFVTF